MNLKPQLLYQVKIWIRTVIGLTLILGAVGGCTLTQTPPTPSQAPTPQPQVTLKISGAGGVTLVLKAIQPAFEADTPNYHLEILTGSGSSGGVKGAIGGVLDLAAMSRPLKDEEKKQDMAYGEFGQAGQAVIIHPDVNVTNLTPAQIQAIFSGQITNWAKVGGPDLPLILYVRDEDDSTTKSLRQFIMGKTPFPNTVAQVLTSQGDMLTAVAGTPGSVGIANWPAALAEKAKVKTVTIDGVAPNSPDYPMLCPFGLGYLTKNQPKVQPLFDWLVSERGRAALKKFDMITK